MYDLHWADDAAAKQQQLSGYQEAVNIPSSCRAVREPIHRATPDTTDLNALDACTVPVTHIARLICGASDLHDALDVCTAPVTHIARLICGASGLHATSGMQ